MGEIFKIAFYVVAVIIWILYKANEQRKSGMWKVRTEQSKDIVAQPLSELKKSKKTIPVKPALTGVSKQSALEQWKAGKKDNPQNRQVHSNSEKTREPVNIIPLLTNDPPVTADAESNFIFDFRQAFISAEILKRPIW